MPELKMRNVVKKVLMPAVFVAALIAVIGSQAAKVNAQGEKLWTVMIHFRYQNGFEFDYLVKRGVPTSQLGVELGTCGQTHTIGPVVKYHCYPVPE